MLISPVTTPAKSDGFARVDTWIPEGKWTDFFTGDVYEAPSGGKKVTMLRTLDYIPALVRDGGVIPLSGDEGNDCTNPHTMIVAAHEGTNTYILYEDGLTGGNSGFLGRSLDVESATRFIAANQFDPGQMVWIERGDGKKCEQQEQKRDTRGFFQFFHVVISGSDCRRRKASASAAS